MTILHKQQISQNKSAIQTHTPSPPVRETYADNILKLTIKKRNANTRLQTPPNTTSNIDSEEFTRPKRIEIQAPIQQRRDESSQKKRGKPPTKTLGRGHSRSSDNNHASFRTFKKQLRKISRFKDDPSGRIINLRKHMFTVDTFDLLNKGLNFWPRPPRFDKITLENDLKTF